MASPVLANETNNKEYEGEWRTNLAWGSSFPGSIDYIEYISSKGLSVFFGAKSFYKTADELGEFFKIGARYYINPGESGIFVNTAIISENQAVDIGGGYQHRISNSWFLNIGGGTITTPPKGIKDEFYIQAGFSLSWSNLMKTEPTRTSRRSTRIIEPEEDIAIGMTTEEVKRILGKPTRINRSVYSFGEREQWVYEYSTWTHGFRGVPFYPYLYFDNGILRSWRERVRIN